MLLPHLFTFSLSKPKVVFLSAALSVPMTLKSKDLPVRKHDVLYCPDFPLSALRRTAIDWFALAQRYVKLFLLRDLFYGGRYCVVGDVSCKFYLKDKSVLKVKAVA